MPEEEQNSPRARPQQHRPLAPPILVRDDDGGDNVNDLDGDAASRRPIETTATSSSSSSSFTDLLLPPSLVSALSAAGFLRPSPVQEAAIPLARARCDLIVQAKSGTGKTAVFAVVALERAAASASASAAASSPPPCHLEALILSPTREVALQTAGVLSRVASRLPQPQPQVAAFVGGTPPEDDARRLRRPLQVAAGTPGRVGALLASGALLPGGGGVGMLVLDEADQLLGQEGLREDTWRVLRRLLPSAAAVGAGEDGAAGAASAAPSATKKLRRPQVLAFSATYTPELMRQLAGGGGAAEEDHAAAAGAATTAATPPLMHRPRRVLLCADGVAPSGILPRYVDVGEAPEEEDDDTDEQQNPKSSLPLATATKLRALLRVLGRLPFQQAVVFANKKPLAPAIAATLARAGFPAVHLSAALTQRERAAALEAVRLLRARVVVATDVLARGVDLARVTLVASLDLPPDAATYAHRCGRTGRFGRKGLAVAFVSGEREAAALRAFAQAAGVAAPEPLRLSLGGLLVAKGDVEEEDAKAASAGEKGGEEEKTDDERAAEAAAAEAAAQAAVAAKSGAAAAAAAQAAAEAAALKHGRLSNSRRRVVADDEDDDEEEDEEDGAWGRLLEARRRVVEGGDKGAAGGGDDLGAAYRDQEEEEDGGYYDDEEEDDDPFGLGSGSSSDEGGGRGGGGGGRAAALIGGLTIAPAAAAYHRRQMGMVQEEEEEEGQTASHVCHFVPPPRPAPTVSGAAAATAATAAAPSPDCVRCWAAAYTRWMHEHAAWQHDFAQWSEWQRDYAQWWQQQSPQM